jgi:hypothetical protein
MLEDKKLKKLIDNIEKGNIITTVNPKFNNNEILNEGIKLEENNIYKNLIDYLKNQDSVKATQLLNKIYSFKLNSEFTKWYSNTLNSILLQFS